MSNFAFTKLIVHDLDTMVEFYCKVFRLRVQHRVVAEHDGVAIKEAILGNDPASSSFVLVKYLDGRTTVNGETINGFMTSDLDRVVSLAEENGGRLDFGPSDLSEHVHAEGRVALIEDPEGHACEIIQLPSEVFAEA